MKSRIVTLITVALLILVMALTSCGGSAIIINIDVSCDEFEQKSSNLENEFEIEIGDKIKAKLCANPTTGFKWDYVLADENVMRFESHDYIEPDSELLGAGGVDVWVFKAIRSGKAVITMEYSKPWEGGTKKERTYTMDVTVMGNR